MKKIKYVLLCTVLLGLSAEVSNAALATALQEARVASRRLGGSFSRVLSTVVMERELAGIGKSRNPTGEIDIHPRAAVHVDWEEQVAIGPRFGEGQGSRVVSVDSIPGVGVFAILEPEERSKKNSRV